MDKLRHTCRSCLYRHGGHHQIKNKCKDFPHEYNEECPDWKIGLCYSCVNYDEDINDHEDKIDAWFLRGCETWCMSGCRKYKNKVKWWKRWMNAVKKLKI